MSSPSAHRGSKHARERTWGTNACQMAWHLFLGCPFGGIRYSHGVTRRLPGLWPLLLAAEILLFAACANHGGNGAASSSSPLPLAPTATVHGKVEDLVTDLGVPGTAVAVAGRPESVARTGGEGEFVLDVGSHVLTTLRTEHPDYVVTRLPVYSTGDPTEPALELPAVPAVVMARMLEEAGLDPQSPDRGLVLVDFLLLPPERGQSAVLSVDHGGVLALDGEGTVTDGRSGLGPDADLLLFTNVAPGHARVSLRTPTGRCSLVDSTLNINDFVVQAGEATVVGVRCVP